jgi:HSP20 family protein
MTPRILTIAIALLALVALFQLAILLQRHLARPAAPVPAACSRTIDWNPEDEIAAMHARVNQMFDQAFATPSFPHPPAATVSPRTAGSQAGSLQEDPFAHMRLIQQRIDNLFATAMNNRRQLSGFDEGWTRLEITPGFNVRDSGDAYDITVQLPGVNKSDIRIQWDHPVLALTVEQNLEQKSQGREGSLRQAQRTSRFERHLRLPGAASRQDAVKASFSNEVLRIIVPKDTQTETPTQSIPIH